MRCRGFETTRRPNWYVQLAQTRELEASAWLGAVPEGRDADFQTRLSAAARDPLTWEYETDLEAICADLGGVKPASEWPAVQALLTRAFGGADQ